MATVTDFPSVPHVEVPEFFREKERLQALPHRGILRRGVKRLMFKAIDNGWFGLCPLDTHIVICGYIRSGSTLLLLITETCVADAKVYNVELPAAGVARNPLRHRNRPFMVTKFPADVFHMDEIRAMYASRRANVRFILTKRDPRSVLVSHHSKHPGYVLTPELWKYYYQAFRHAQEFDDTFVVKYEDLVRDPNGVEKPLADFIGWTVRVPFGDFYTHVSPEIPHDSALNLNGLRPLDKSGIASWKKPEHRARIRSLLHALPELPDCLIEMGYETDTSWVEPYLE
jgi:Sulfotransferase family